MIVDIEMPSSRSPLYGSNPFPKAMYNVQGRPKPTVKLNVLLPNYDMKVNIKNRIRFGCYELICDSEKQI